MSEFCATLWCGVKGDACDFPVDLFTEAAHDCHGRWRPSSSDHDPILPSQHRPLPRSTAAKKRQIHPSASIFTLLDLVFPLIHSTLTAKVDDRSQGRRGCTPKASFRGHFFYCCRRSVPRRLPKRQRRTTLVVVVVRRSTRRVVLVVVLQQRRRTRFP